MARERVIPSRIYGGSVKAGDIDGDTLTVTGPGVILDEKNSKERDLYGEYFTKDTYFGKMKGDGVDAFFHHKSPLLQVGWFSSGVEHIIPERLFKFFKNLADHRFTNAVSTRFDEETSVLAATLILNMRNEYEEFVGKQAQKGLLSWSSGSAGHVSKIDWDTGEIKEWPIIEFSLTPTPAEPRIRVEASKSFSYARKFLLDTGSISEEKLNKAFKDSLKSEIMAALKSEMKEDAKKDVDSNKKQENLEKSELLLEHNDLSPEYWYEIGRRKALITQLDRLINEY